MDAHLARLKQMSYAHQHQQQHLLTNQQTRVQRSHYSNRQQTNQHQHQYQHQNQNQSHKSAPQAKKSTSSAGSSSDNDDHLQLSSLSTSTTNKTNSSQQAMLAHNLKAASQHQQHLMHQQHQKQRQAAHQRHQQQASQLQAHNSAAKAAFAKSSGSAADNMTTSSSDHTIADDLHHLAHGYGQHRLTGAGSSRYSGDTATGSDQSQSGSRFLLGVLFTLAELLLFACLLLWLYWAYQHDDGLAWQSERKQQFNTHAALMLAGFIFLNGQAMLIYRSFQCCSKIYTKILHTILFVLATSAISLGLMLGYMAQDNVGPGNKPIMHFYSLHAWCGLATVGLFVFQFVFGFVSFLILLCCDTATTQFRAALLPIHRTFGLTIFSLAIATCLTGLLQTARSRLSSKLNKQDYHELGEAGIVINLIGVGLIFLAIIMPYIIRNLDIKRNGRSELDRHLKLSQLDMRI